MGMMINRRRAYGGDKSLPYDAEIEYLESGQTQYIKTNYIPNDNTYLECVYMTAQEASPLSVGNLIFGARVAYKKNQLYVFSPVNIITQNSIYISNYSGDELNFDFYLNLIGEKVTVIIDIPNKRACLYNIWRSSKERFSNNCTLPLYLFRLNQNNDVFEQGTVESYGKIRIYSFKVTENAGVKIDLIPVRVGQVGYMYDKVSKKLFGNAGTGNFILGPDV